MKSFVNFLSAFRIFAAFAIIPTFMFQMFWLTFILYVLGSVSDWFDGYLARRYNVCSKIGGVMDHIGDKLLVSNTLIMLATKRPEWFIVLPIILMIARELYISGLREFMGTQKMEMPVPKARFSMGKVKTTFQMIAIGAFLLIFAIGSTITTETTGRITLVLAHILPKIGMWGLWISLVASLWSATQYTHTFIQKIKQLKK